jgi:hypothetical protein
MHGRAALTFRLLLLAALGLAGCDESHRTVYLGDDEAPAKPPKNLAAAFDPASSGSVAGRVTWAGAAPVVAPYRAPISPLSEQPDRQKFLWPNPHVPAVDPASRGVAGAVVFLRGVDAERARPWNHAPVRVAVRDCRYHVLQGDADEATGFVRRGDKVTIVREDDHFQAVQARGAAFFTLTLAARDRPHDCVLARTGVVELGSNSGQFWMRAHLFVADHPYLTRTDAQGRFSLEQVPPGTYELGCWLPDWHEAAHELDAETSLVTRLTFRPSVVKLREVAVETGVRRTADFSYGAADFGR